MKLRNLFLLSMIVTLSLAFAACDDGDKKDPNPCGNGVLDPGEECDGTNLNEATCSSVVPTRPGGDLACTLTCTFDTADCAAPECGNGIREGSEECDGTDLGDTECGDIAGFDGGVLGCTEGCTWDTDECTIDCVVEDNFETCNPMGGANECCPNNGMPSTCFSSGDFRACLQTCSDHPDCGWSMECINPQGICYIAFCGEGMEMDDLQDPCTLAGGRAGVCYPVWRAMDDGGICFENGTLGHGEVCPLADAMGTVDVDPATQCNNGFCFGPSGATEGNCFSKCNPIDVYTSHNDPCPANSACVNFASIDLDEFLDDGTTQNSNFLFREPDLGVCYVWETDNEIYTCDLITGNVITGPGTGECPCPDGMTCNYFGLGSLLGFCYDVAAAPKAEGVTCTITEGAPQDCAEGLQCFISDPFNTDGSALACRTICDATVYADNEACAGLVDGDGQAYVCLTTSRFFTEDRELPKVGTGLNAETETSPSPLGFCVPPVAAGGK